jgi:hypothetical protein
LNLLAQQYLLTGSVIVKVNVLDLLAIGTITNTSSIVAVGSLIIVDLARQTILRLLAVRRAIRLPAMRKTIIGRLAMRQVIVKLTIASQLVDTSLSDSSRISLGDHSRNQRQTPLL